LEYLPHEIENMVATSYHSNDAFRLLKLELLTNDNDADESQRATAAAAQARNRTIIERCRQKGGLPREVEDALDISRDFSSISGQSFKPISQTGSRPCPTLLSMEQSVIILELLSRSPNSGRRS
jgi:hypothetical protein